MYPDLRPKIGVLILRVVLRVVVARAAACWQAGAPKAAYAGRQQLAATTTTAGGQRAGGGGETPQQSVSMPELPPRAAPIFGRSIDPIPTRG